MLCNEQSYYPNKVDKMTFFQDVSLNTIEYMNEYQYLLSMGRYSDANKYINNKTGIYGYFACFFNMLENRIYTLQQYLSSGINNHDTLSNYIHDELSSYTHDDISLIVGGKTKFNQINNQSEMPTRAIAGVTNWTGGKYIRK